MASATVSRLRREECEDCRESQCEGQGEDSENHADRPAQPTSNTTLGNAQPPRIPRDSAMVRHLHWEECEIGRGPQEKGHGEDRKGLAD
eukprot:3288816-Pyramimonas_sp.AAC.1